MSNEIADWIESTSSRALAFAISLVRQRATAEEIVQECYLKLLQKAETYELSRDGDRLLFKSIANACINWTQRRPPEVNLSEMGSAGAAIASYRPAPPEEVAIRNELESAIEIALGELPVEQRAVVELSALGCSSVEIAEAVGVQAGHARVLLHRARATLAQRLMPFLEDNRT